MKCRKPASDDVKQNRPSSRRSALQGCRGSAPTVTLLPSHRSEVFGVPVGEIHNNDLTIHRKNPDGHEPRVGRVGRRRRWVEAVPRASMAAAPYRWLGAWSGHCGDLQACERLHVPGGCLVALQEPFQQQFQQGPVVAGYGFNFA